MVSLRSLRERLPKSVAEVAHDSAWTMAFEAMAIITVTSSFLMLGSQLGPEGYGDYVGLFAILTPISAIGSAAALATLQACFQEQRPVDQVMSTFLLVVFVGGSVATGIAALVVPLILESLSLTAIVTISVAELVLAPMVRVLSGGIRFIKGVPASVRVQLAMLLMRFGVLLALFLAGTLSVDRIGIGWMAMTAIVVTWLLAEIIPNLGVQLRPHRVAMSDIRMIGALGSPIYISEFQTNGDKAVLAGSGLREQAGLYGAAFRIATLALTPLRAMDVAVFHRFLESDENRPGAHVRRVRTYTLWSLAVVLPISVVLLIAAPLLPTFVGSDFERSVGMTRWLVLWLPIRVISLAPLSGLLGLAKLGLRLVVLIFSAGLAMITYLILIPRMGWEGAVIGTVVSEAVLAVLAWAALLKAQRERDASLVHEQVSPHSAAAAPA